MRGPTESDKRKGGGEGSQVNSIDTLGCKLITELTVLMKKLGKESLDMQVVVSVLGNLRDTLNRLSALLKGEPRLTVQGRSFFISNHPIELDLEAFRLAQELSQAWKRIYLGELVFPRQTTEAALANFCGLLNGALYDVRRAAVFYGRKKSDQVRPVPMPKEPQKQAQIAAAHRVTGLYASLMLLVRKSVEQVQKGEPLPLLQIRRAVKEIMESMAQHGGLLLGLCYSPQARKSEECASVAIMLHALVVGQLLRMPRRNLLELGLAALFSDLGRLGGAQGERRFPMLEEALDDDPELREHLLALAHLLSGPGLKVDSFAPAVTLFEGPDLFSRPDRYACDTPELKRPFLYSRIIAVCALFDQLVWPWRKDSEALPLEKQVARWNQAMAELDPVVVRVFVEFLGLFPIGSIVKLDSQEVAIVVAQRKGQPDRPLVLVVVDTVQRLRVSGPLVDLSREKERRIIGLADASVMGLNPVPCFMVRRK